jgi:8-oxo-dGTP diphosphatase
VKAYLVRHAHAGDRDSWEGDDRLRPLTDKGWSQARGLAAELGGEEIGRVVSSSYLRCVQTVEPLAEALGLAVQVDDAFAEGSPWREALARLTRASESLVACSQGDVIGSIIDDLAGRGVIPPGDIRWQKGSAWVLTVEAGDVVAAAYQPPVEADA